MGILSWWGDNKKAPLSSGARQPEKPDPMPKASPDQPDPMPKASPDQPESPGMNGAVEVPRTPVEVTVFEFGSVADSTDKVTLAGYCPVSDDFEPCQWAILPASGEDAPQFRVIF